MWTRTILFCAAIVPLLGKHVDVIYDVTTVFEAENSDGAGRVHVRTNALGLPMYGGRSNIASEIPQLLNITCDSFENICSWKTQDWSTSYEYPSNDMAEKQLYNFYNGLEMELSGPDSISGSENYLYFASESDIRSGLFHAIIFRKESNYRRGYRRMYEDEIKAEFRRSCRNIYTGINYHPNMMELLNRNGNIIWTSCEYTESLGSVHYKSLKFTFDDYITIKTNSQTWGGFLQSSWKNNIDVKYFYMTSSTHQFKITLKPSGPVYTSSSIDSEIISSKFRPGSTQMCLLILFKSPTDSTEPLLEIIAEDSTNERFTLQTINSTKVGWNTVHQNLNLPEMFNGSINLLIKKKNSVKISIARISSCSTDGEEVKLLKTSINLDKHVERFSLSLFTATAHVIGPVKEEIPSNTTSCLNGGVLTEAGCACPPGFSASNCQLGCGRNRFGQDCGGLCSLWNSGCEGLMLCTNPTGCHCAPGYKGEYCKTKCSDGWYGNDCSQRCGHCFVTPCDIYTGECSACEPGYLPPLCKYESAYYSSKPLLTSPEYGMIRVSFNAKEYVPTSGTPEVYQIQYKEQNGDWKIVTNKNIEKNSDGSVKDMTISENIEGLMDGITYHVRVLFMDENFYKYDGNLVQLAEIITKCEIPEVVEYKVKVESYTESLIFSWSYDNAALHGCPVEVYEVSWSARWRQFTNQTYSNFFEITGLLPGTKIGFKVRAKTRSGYFPYSTVLFASTITNDLSVRNLKIDSVQSTSIEVSWDPPTGSDDQKLQYLVSFMCIDQPACSPGCQNISEGQMTIKDTNITLKPLVPFTRYLVSVTPQNGLASTIYAGTSREVPTEIPRPSNQSPLRTNTSVTVFWDQPDVCSSFLLGYNYHLVKESQHLKVLDTGFTKDTSISFHNLTASTQYTARISVVTIAGWNPKSYLEINVSTSATVPEAVQNLTVYKRGKGMLGLRWAPPRAVYGQLKSFTVTYTLGQEVTNHTIEPTPCAVWPELFCYTIESLKSNRCYNLTVTARNTEIPEDGEPTSITGATKESLPTVARNLKLVNSTSTNIILQWKYPEMANGIVRSFLISVEETENYDQDSCCQIYPLMEIMVKEETETYETEISGLHPASTYFVSVSAKTVGIGPSQSLVVQTRPPHLPLTSLPRVEVSSVEELTWLPQQSLPDVNNSEIYTPLVKAHMVLAVVNESLPIQLASDTGITDNQLNMLLQNMIKKPFYFLTEYNQGDVVTVVGSLESTESVWGQTPSTLKSLQIYQLIAVQVSNYNGTFNADLQFSLPFTLSP